MEKELNEAGAQRQQASSKIGEQLVTINLLRFVEQIRKERPWKENSRNAITVFKTGTMRIVLIALHKGVEMMKHATEGPISVQVLEGKMLFKTEEQSVELGKGQMLALHEGISHSLMAKEETVFLLTLATVLVVK